jgi:hypothetical protein
MANMKRGLIDDGPAHILAQGDTDGDNQLSLVRLHLLLLLIGGCLL